MAITALIAAVVSAALGLSGQKVRSPRDQFVIRIIYYALLLASAVILVSALSGRDWDPRVEAAAFVFIGVYLLLQILAASFWGKVGFHALLVAHLFIGGYLYTLTQIPYENRPFRAISSNQPVELKTSDLPQRSISGVPTERTAAAETTAQKRAAAPLTRRNGRRHDTQHRQALRWSSLAGLMQKDSQIRSVLRHLKEKQARELSEALATMNSTSVANTKMRRNALDRSRIDNLLREGAISKARHRTMIETWRLLDQDEHAFRTKQAEERFHVLLELLEDDTIDESHKVEFIDFMVSRFSDDVRLVKPLIRIFDRLDSEYPRSKRLNQAFLDLYIAKREAVLRGFEAIGQAALQPLLDYRKETISSMTYSQARLDLFLQRTFGASIRPLYKMAAPQSIPDFLNREKYPPLEWLAGASFEQDYIRRSLKKMTQENRPPEPGEPVMGLAPAGYREITEAFRAGYPDRIDYLVIDPDPAVRATLAWHLAELKNPYTLPLVFELMRDTDPDVRRIAAIAVGNFEIVDTQGSHDQKFIEITRMLQNYRSSSDAFGRAWAVNALATVGDRQKALYIIDLILNDGISSHSTLGDAAPTWRSRDEKESVQGLIDTLQQTPEELLVKTEALNTLIAIESPESLGILLHYLHHIYTAHDSRPTMWRYIVPHVTLPQEAENVEDVIDFIATRHGSSGQSVHKRHLKALHLYLRRAYENGHSGEFFQLLRFLRTFDADEYNDYRHRNREQIRIMRIKEYVHATAAFWLVFWPLSLFAALFISYVVLPFFNLTIVPHGGRHPSNLRANPAADPRRQTVAPASTIVPVKIARTK